MPPWRRASRLPPARVRGPARLVLILLLEIVVILVLLTVVGRLVIPLVAPAVVVATPTPVA